MQIMGKVTDFTVSRLLAAIYRESYRREDGRSTYHLPE